MNMDDQSLRPKNDRYLVVKGSGGAGIGDKLRAVISAVVYARISGRRLYVDWSDPAYGDGTYNYFPDLFRLEGVMTTNERPLRGSVRPAAWQGKLDLNWDRLYAEAGAPPWNRARAIEMYSFDQGVLDWPEDICVMWDYDQFPKLVPHLPGLYPGLRGDEPPERMQGEVLRTHLKPAPDIVAAQEAYLRRMAAARPVVGVHVRASNESFRARVAPPVGAYVRAVERIMARGAAKSVFLATDNPAVQEMFRARFGAANVIWTDKWLPEPGGAIHLDGTCPDRLQAARDAVLDVLLLAETDELVTFRSSSFGIVARMFAKAPENHRITLAAKLPLWRRALLKIPKWRSR
jgi:hypothetical protein